MSGNNVTRHVAHWSSIKNMSSVPADLIVKSSRDGIVN